jgi:hypothetical protein
MVKFLYIITIFTKKIWGGAFSPPNLHVASPLVAPSLSRTRASDAPHPTPSLAAPSPSPLPISHGNPHLRLLPPIPDATPVPSLSVSEMRRPSISLSAPLPLRLCDVAPDPYPLAARAALAPAGPRALSPPLSLRRRAPSLLPTVAERRGDARSGDVATRGGRIQLWCAPGDLRQRPFSSPPSGGART